jgi:hypothetical protein
MRLILQGTFVVVACDCSQFSHYTDRHMCIAVKECGRLADFLNTKNHISHEAKSSQHFQSKEECKTEERGSKASHAQCAVGPAV